MDLTIYIEVKQLIRKLQEALATYNKAIMQNTKEVVAAKIKETGIPDLLKEEYADVCRSIDEILQNKAYDPVL